MPAHARGAGAGTGGEAWCMGDTGLVEAGRDALPFELTPGAGPRAGRHPGRPAGAAAHDVPAAGARAPAHPPIC